MLAQRRGLRVHEVPVDWVDDTDSRVDIVSTAIADLRGVARLVAAGSVARFVAVGVASTVAYALLYLLLRGMVVATVANGIALAVTAVANTAANRRLTFGVRGREGLVRQHVLGAIVYLITLGLTTGALTVLHAMSAHPSRALEASVLVVASACATVTRYVGLRWWVFARRQPAIERRDTIDLCPPIASTSPSPTRPTQLIASDPMALLVGFVLDQQVTVQKAFAGPLVLRERLGAIDAATLASADLEPVFRERPALHRYPGAMAKRVHDLAVHVRDNYDGDAARIWTSAADSGALRANLLALPGFGEMKIKAFGAVLAKRFGVEAARDLVPWHPTLGDVESAQDLADYQAAKRVHKAEWQKAKTA